MKTRTGLALVVAGVLAAIPCTLKSTDSSNRIQEIRDSNPQIFQSEPYRLKAKESTKNTIYGILDGLALSALGIGGIAIHNNYYKRR